MAVFEQGRRGEWERKEGLWGRVRCCFLFIDLRVQDTRPLGSRAQADDAFWVGSQQNPNPGG